MHLNRTPFLWGAQVPKSAVTVASSWQVNCFCEESTKLSPGYKSKRLAEQCSGSVRLQPCARPLKNQSLHCSWTAQEASLVKLDGTSSFRPKPEVMGMICHIWPRGSAEQRWATEAGLPCANHHSSTGQVLLPELLHLQSADVISTVMWAFPGHPEWIPVSYNATPKHLGLLLYNPRIVLPECSCSGKACQGWRRAGPQEPCTFIRLCSPYYIQLLPSRRTTLFFTQQPKPVVTLAWAHCHTCFCLYTFCVPIFCLQYRLIWKQRNKKMNLAKRDYHLCLQSPTGNSTSANHRWQQGFCEAWYFNLFPETQAGRGKW